MHFDPFPRPHDPRWSPLSTVRMGTPEEESDAFALAQDLIKPDAPDRDGRCVRLAGMIRIVLRRNPAATLDDLRNACDQVTLASMRDALIFPN